MVTLEKILTCSTLFTMSIESEQGFPTPELQHMFTFPISEKAVRDSIDWYTYVTSRSPYYFEVEKDKQQRNDNALFSYLEHMSKLRNEIHLSEEQSAQYMNGAVFGVNLLANQYQHVGLELPPSNEHAVATYFKSLITDRDARKNSDMKYNILVATQPGILKTPITPKALTERMVANYSDPLLKEVQIRFKTNSAVFQEQMLESEPELANASTAIGNLVDSGKRGFILGILDVYAPFKMDHVVGPYVEVLDVLEF